MRKLWLDLGNTRLKYWLTEGNQVIAQQAMQHLQAPAELLLGLQDKLVSLQPSFVGVSSVLGQQVNQRVAHTLDKLHVPHELVKVNANHQYMQSQYDANLLGVDRWLQMLAVANVKQNLCVVSCGTAVTIDLVPQAVHMGGYIFPSIYLQREALQAGTRQISIADGEFASIDVGKNTADAVHRGILLSIVGAIHEVMRTHPTFDLVLTGGDAHIVAQHLATDGLLSHNVIHKSYIENDLLLQGLQRYFQAV